MTSIAFVDTNAHPTADNFYRLFPKEPVPPAKSNDFVTVDKIVSLPKMSLEKLLEEIIANVKKKGSIVTVSHGTDVAMKITIGPAKNRIGLDTSALDLFERNREGKESDGSAASRLKMKGADFQKLKKAIDDVRALELDRVDMRACRIGSNAFTMSRFRGFFNCKTLSAPIIYDTFGPIPVGRIVGDARSFDRWLKQHKKAQLHGAPPNRFALQYVIGGSNVALDACAESQQAIDDWVANHLPKGKYTKGPLFYHGVTDKARIVFSGEPAFRSNLAEMNKSKEPSKKIDLDTLDF